MNKSKIFKSFLESIKSLDSEKIEGIMEAVSVIYEAEMDPVGKEDADVNNDGNVDEEDKYLLNRRKVITGEIEEEEAEEEAKMEAEETKKQTPALDKLIDALTQKVKQEGNEKLATLLAQVSKEKKVLTESEGGLWVKDAHPDEGKMHRLLDIPKGKKVTDVYKSGKELAKDLLKANKGDKRKTGGMLGFIANVNKGKNVFDTALKSLPELEGNKD